MLSLPTPCSAVSLQWTGSRTGGHSATKTGFPSMLKSLLALAATRVYAKVDLLGLREAAEFDLRGLS
jgi:hypothetical protein